MSRRGRSKAKGKLRAAARSHSPSLHATDFIDDSAIESDGGLEDQKSSDTMDSGRSSPLSDVEAPTSSVRLAQNAPLPDPVRAESSDEEDASRLLPNDSMFGRTGGFKTSLLGPPLKTRSSKRASSPTQSDAGASDSSPTKRPRLVARAPPSDSSDDEVEVVNHRLLPAVVGSQMDVDGDARFSGMHLSGSPDLFSQSSTLVSDISHPVLSLNRSPHPIDPVRVSSFVPPVVALSSPLFSATSPAEDGGLGSLSSPGSSSNFTASSAVSVRGLSQSSSSHLAPSSAPNDLDERILRQVEKSFASFIPMLVAQLQPVPVSPLPSTPSSGPVAPVATFISPTPLGDPVRMISPPAKKIEPVVYHRGEPSTVVSPPSTSNLTSPSASPFSHGKGGSRPTSYDKKAKLAEMAAMLESPTHYTQAATLTASPQPAINTGEFNKEVTIGSPGSPPLPMTDKEVKLAKMAAMFSHFGGASSTPEAGADNDLLDAPGHSKTAVSDGPTGSAFLSSTLLPMDPQLCLDDLETYTNQFDPRAVCGVYDEDLEDEHRKGCYDGLPPLPGDRWVVATYDPNNQCTEEGNVGGHLMFSYWATVLRNASPATVLSVMDFTRSGIYINPSRVSPSLITTKSTNGISTTNFRMLVEGSIAISVMAGMCTESHITEAMPGAGNPPRMRRYLCLMPHNLDWERWQSFICLVYGHHTLFTPITANAIHMGSVISQGNSTATTPAPASLPPNMVSPMKSKKGKQSQWSGSASQPSSEILRYALNHDETIPAFNACGVDFDFDADIPNMAKLLRPWKGEIPKGAFIATGYTPTTYVTNVSSRNKQRLPCVGCNLLWVVVCGTSR